MNGEGHRPVLLQGVLACLAPRDGAVLVDATFGGGGISAALLAAADCRVLAIDRDPEAIARGRPLARRWRGRLELCQGRFSRLEATVAGRLGAPVDGVIFDLGVSSFQLDEARRGFSFRRDGPLDMRMEGEGAGAAEAVNNLGEAQLAAIVARFGEERRARAVARAIVAARRLAPIATTLQLARIVRGAVGRRRDGIDPATRTFQALRIWVNDELGELERGLAAAEAVLREGGRLATIAFHSLEDRTVKRFLMDRSGRLPAPNRHLPSPPPERQATFRLLRPHPLRPGGAEVAANRRARSARLRAAARTAAPPWRQAA